MIIDTPCGIRHSKQVKLTNIENGEIRVFGSQHSACKELGIHPWALKSVIKGKNNHAKGWKVESYEDISSDEWDKMDKHTTAVQLVCPHCKSAFWMKFNKANRQNRFCSQKCRNESYKLYAKNGYLQRNEKGELICYSCLKYKKDEDFYLNTNDYNGFAAIRNRRFTKCKDCQNRIGKSIRIKNKNNLVFILRSRLITARSSSKARKIFFDSNLTYQDLMDIYERQHGVCPISGQILGINSDKTPYTISLDRKDSSKGYTKDNIHLVCWAVNQMKNNYSLEELLKWCSFIISNNKLEVQAVSN